jgi:hypothetical protein
MKLHISQPNLPGGLLVPRPIDVINEKIDLINRLLDLSEKVGQEERNTLKQLRIVELEAIKDLIISCEDTKSQKAENSETENYFKDYIGMIETLQKQFEEVLNKKSSK